MSACAAGRGADPARSADPGRLARPAQDAGQGKLDLFGEARGIAEARSLTRGGTGPGSAASPGRGRPGSGRPGSRIGRQAGHWAHARGTRATRLPDVSAIAAFDLSEPAHQVDAGAYRAPVKLAGPVHRRLAGWADQHLAVGPNPSFPGTLSPVRVDLPCATPIAGHEVCSDSAVPRERADR